MCQHGLGNAANGVKPTGPDSRVVRGAKPVGHGSAWERRGRLALPEATRTARMRPTQPAVSERAQPGRTHPGCPDEPGSPKLANAYSIGTTIVTGNAAITIR